MNPRESFFGCFVKTCADYRRYLRETRQDPWIALCFSALIVILGDDISLWFAGLVSVGLKASLASLPGLLRTGLFGVAPAALLMGALVHADWNRLWRRNRAKSPNP